MVFTSGISAGIAFLHQFDGTQWKDSTQWKNGRLNQAGSLWDIWGNNVEDVWAVGTGRNNVGFLLRWDGMAWDFAGYEGAPLRSVWGTSPNDVWTVAYDGPIQHWNGTGWQVYAADFRLFGIWGSGASDVWAIGAEGLLVHFDGTDWAEISSGTTKTCGASGAAPRMMSGLSAATARFSTSTARRGRRHFARVDGTGRPARSATSAPGPPLASLAPSPSRTSPRHRGAKARERVGQQPRPAAIDP